MRSPSNSPSENREDPEQILFEQLRQKLAKMRANGTDLGPLLRDFHRQTDEYEGRLQRQQQAVQKSREQGQQQIARLEGGRSINKTQLYDHIQQFGRTGPEIAKAQGMRIMEFILKVGQETDTPEKSYDFYTRPVEQGGYGLKPCGLSSTDLKLLLEQGFIQAQRHMGDAAQQDGHESRMILTKDNQLHSIHVKYWQR